MKILEKLQFSAFTEMDDREMKLTFGGSGCSGIDWDSGTPVVSGTDGMECYQTCFNANNRRVGGIWGTCHHAFHRCNELTAGLGHVQCNCNG